MFRFFAFSKKAVKKNERVISLEWAISEILLRIVKFKVLHNFTIEEPNLSPMSVEATSEHHEGGLDVTKIIHYVSSTLAVQRFASFFVFAKPGYSVTNDLFLLF